MPDILTLAAADALPPGIALLLYATLVVGTAVVLLLISQWLGPSRIRKSKSAPYECGVPELANTRQPFNVRFFVVAVLFIVFDVELILVVPWATVFKYTGAVGFIGMMVFLVVLVVGLVYEWRKGALEWE